MKISVILTTYNWPEALELSLRSFMAQTDSNFEVVVADDGSKEPTRLLIEQLRAVSPVPILHAWQEDRGFRAAKARNEAVKLSSGDYLLFVDGDCMVGRDFVAAHRRHAEKGVVIAGQRILISEALASVLLASPSKAESWSWCSSFSAVLKKWRSGGVNKISPLVSGFGIANLLCRRGWQRLRTCHCSLFKSDFLQVGGFDESFEGWGQEDSDLAIRLINAGVKLKLGYFGAPVFHVWHPTHAKDASEEAPRLRLLRDRIERRVTEPERSIFR